MHQHIVLFIVSTILFVGWVKAIKWVEWHLPGIIAIPMMELAGNFWFGAMWGGRLLYAITDPFGQARGLDVGEPIPTFAHGEAWYGVFLLLGVSFPFWLGGIFKKRRISSLVNRSLRSLEKVAGPMQKASYYDVDIGSGIAYFQHDHSFVFHDGKSTQRYPLSSIRSIIGVEPAMVTVSGGNPSEAYRRQHRLNVESTYNSGLFIDTKDVNHPKWRLTIFERDIQAKWVEIFRQALEQTRS